MAKNIFVSKTFWLNIIGAGATVALNLPEKYAVPTLGILNIANRFLTSQPVTLPFAAPSTTPPPTTSNYPGQR